MSFAELLVAEMSAAYNLPKEPIFILGDRLKIAYKNQDTRLALADAKAVIGKILSAQSHLDTLR